MERGHHTHEYGHHWVANFALSPAPFYCNGICDTDGCGHCLWCRETDNVSFNEGYPDWMGDVIPGSFAAAYGVAALVGLRHGKRVQVHGQSRPIR